jgi:peptidoglycan/xylan/chitin deacetylase (PgdA/CDA1 family)
MRKKDMVAVEAVILMYHDLSPDDRASSGRNPYVLASSVFRSHLGAARAVGLPGTTIGAWVKRRRADAGFHRPELILTFDDGDLSNYERALPLLLDSGFPATFFVTVGRVGTPGALSWSQINDLHRAGMEIGSHTMTHRPPILLDDTELRYEVRESKARLEDRLGAAVVSLSSPTGFFNSRMSAIAREEGYTAVCGGRMAVARRSDSSYHLPRIAIKPSLGLAEFDQILRLSRFRLVRLRGDQIVRNGLKNLLGPRSYLRLRRLLLEARG